MKLWFLFFLLFGTFFGVTFANDTIQFEVSTQDLELGEDIKITIQFESPENTQENLQIDIPGIDNFEVFSQGQSFSFDNINGGVQSMLQYTIVASAKTTGTFTLGPVVLGTGSGALTDDTVFDISVREQTQQLPTKGSLDTLSQERETEKQEIFGPQREGSLLLWFLFFAFLTLALPVFFLLKKYFSEQTIQEKPTFEKLPQDEVLEISHRDFFQDLLTKSDSLLHEVFFESFNGKLRDIFGSILDTEVQYKTLGELKAENHLTTHPLFGVFEKSYMLQYHPQGVTISQRRELCESILSLL